MKKPAKLVKKILPPAIYGALKNNPARRRRKAAAWGKEHGAHYKGRRVFLLNTPEHTNLGDLAIAEAELDFLSRIMPGEPLAEVGALSRNIYALDALKKMIPKDALILFHGGGYVGTDWPEEEEAFRRAVRLFPENRFVLMPQSIYYSGDAVGQAALERSARDLSRHGDLHLFARESVSYGLMKRHYPNAKVYLSPDMVLSMSMSISMEHGAGEYAEAGREGALMCMRADKEKLLTGSDTAYIESVCAKYGRVEYTDTIVAPDEYSGPVNAATRGALVSAKLAQFSKARLVVTDRLHGMVFAAVTGTPCVALSNHNHKVKGTAEWLKGLTYIRYAENTGALAEAAEAVIACGAGAFNGGGESLLPHFDGLARVILKKL